MNVKDYLKRAHATVVLAENGGLVKSFPHSLIKSLVVGRPVLLTNTIAMADYVNSRQCGVVVEDMNIEVLSAAIGNLKRNYELFARNAAQIGRDEFSIDNLVENHRRLYGL